MLRNVRLFTVANRAMATNIRVKMKPVTSVANGQYATSMVYDVFHHNDDNNESHEMDMECIVPHKPTRNFSELLEALKDDTLTPEGAAMITIANQDKIPANKEAVEQVKGLIKPTYDLSAYLRFELGTIFQGKEFQEKLTENRPSPLTGLY